MERPIRILHCLPGDMNQGGIENFLMNIYRVIDKNLFQFDFIIHSKEESFYEKEIKQLGGRVYRVAQKSKNYKLYEKDMNKLLSEHKEYKIIHIHATYAISIFDEIIAKKHGLKVIVHAHSSNDILKRKLIHFALKRKLSKETQYKFACSLKAAEWLFTKKSLRKNSLTIINNSIDSKKFVYNLDTRNSERKSIGVEGKFVIGIVSRLSYLKNINFLIDIFNEIYKVNKNSVLLIVGEGPEKENLQNKVIKKGLEHNVIFYGKSNAVHRVLQAIDVFVMPSKCEGFGISLLEAQAAGIKCFTSKNVVPNEIKIKNIENELEFISLRRSSKFWAKKILKWNIEYKRNEMSNKIIEAGYDLNKNISKIQDKYMEILGE